MEPLLADKEPTPVGFGWTMHMGRVRSPNASGQPSAWGGGDYPIYEAPDGTARVFYPDAGSNSQFTSRDFWKLAKNCATAAGSGVCITTTSGRRLEFASSAQFFIGVPPVWPMTAMVDLYGNSIAVTYDNGRLRDITDSWNRTVTFTYSTCGARQCLDSILASGVGGSAASTTATQPIRLRRLAGRGAFLFRRRDARS